MQHDYITNYINVMNKYCLRSRYIFPFLQSGITQTLTSSASTSAAIPPQGASAGADEVSTSQTRLDFFPDR